MQPHPQSNTQALKALGVFDNGDSLEKRFGSGSGSGGGDNYNNAFTTDDNPDAELGTQGWTASAGSFSVLTQGDAKAFSWTPTAQNDTLSSSYADVDNFIFWGNACQAQIYYVGGDDNLTLKAINADGDELGSLELQAHSIFGAESFQIEGHCPKEAAIDTTANLGQIKLVLENTGTSAAANIIFKKAYLGTLIGLSEATLSGVCSANISSTGTIDSQACDLIDSCTQTGTGTYECDFKSGALTVVPTVTLQIHDSNTNINQGATIQSGNLDTDGFSYSTGYTTTGTDTTLSNYAVSVIITKQGADAKQSVQVWKNIPKVNNNSNYFTARIDISTGGVTRQSPDTWLSCTNTGTGINACTFVNLDLDNPMNCMGKVWGTGTNTNYNLGTTGESSTGLTVVGAQNGAYLNAVTATISCYKQGSDYKTETTQPIVVGQVRNSYAESASKNIREESCMINYTGTVNTNSGLCESWIDSITHSTTGVYIFNIKSGIFSSYPVCTTTPAASSASAYTSHALTYSAVQVYTETHFSGSKSDVELNISCKGVY